MNKKRLTEAEIEDIKKTVRKQTKTEQPKPEDAAVKIKNLTPEQIANTIKQMRQRKEVSQQNQNPEMEQSQQNTRNMSEERQERLRNIRNERRNINSQTANATYVQFSGVFQSQPFSSYFLSLL